MTIPDGTRASILIADYIGIDAGGKVNALGLGFSATGIQPTGYTAPQYVAVIIEMPAKEAGTQIPMTLELRDLTTNTVVTAPNPSGQFGALRIQQLMPVTQPVAAVPGVFLPNDLDCRMQALVAFPNGVALTQGHKYVWRLEINGIHRKGWEAHFYVLAPTPQLVIGGPAGPADIPNIVNPQPDDDDEDEESDPDGP